MFGIYRTALAIVVIFDHIGGFSGAGAVSVFGFFVLSGFLMTLLMAETYRDAPLPFYANRFLRLYPLYWTAFLATLLLQWWNGLLVLPASRLDFIYQALYVVRFTDNPAYVPAGWAVTNEMVFYVLIGMGISRSPPRAAIWLAVSVAVVAVIYEQNDTIFTLYFPVLAGSLPFAIGALLYHLNKHIPAIPAPGVALALAACAMVATMVPVIDSLADKNYAVMPWIYLSFVPSALIVTILYRIKSPRLWLFDEAVGRLSYPLYLMHFLGAKVAAYFGLYVPGTTGIAQGFTVMAVTALLAIAALALVDTPIQAIRRRLRPSHAKMLQHPQKPGTGAKLGGNALLEASDAG